jgi:acyl-CoA hydrolase
LDYQQEYEKKLISADEAVKIVKSGDWIGYPLGICGANELAAALARREKAVQFNELPAVVTPLAPDVFMATVAPMDQHGWFNWGASAVLSRASARNARKVLVEVNTNMPRVLGGNSEAIHISEIDFIYESTNPPLPVLNPIAPSETEKRIAGYVIERFRNGCCIQLGQGGIPGAVGAAVAASDLRDLGVHTELYVEAFLEMTEAGKITGRRKTIDPLKQVFSFAWGSKRLYDFLDNNPGLASYPLDYVNHPGRIGRNDNVVSVHAAIAVDLLGQICSESVGTGPISGTGAQLAFMEGAYRSPGGQSFVCLTSTSKQPDGSLQSNIKPVLTRGAIITCPRSASPVVVTEYGTADMKGRTAPERTEALINIAHPSFRDKLISAAKHMKIWH